MPLPASQRASLLNSAPAQAPNGTEIAGLPARHALAATVHAHAQGFNRCL